VAEAQTTNHGSIDRQVAAAEPNLRQEREESEENRRAERIVSEPNACSVGGVSWADVPATGVFGPPAGFRCGSTTTSWGKLATRIGVTKANTFWHRRNSPRGNNLQPARGGAGGEWKMLRRVADCRDLRRV
jgi:hypothetical protein